MFLVVPIFNLTRITKPNELIHIQTTHIKFLKKSQNPKQPTNNYFRICTYYIFMLKNIILFLISFLKRIMHVKFHSILFNSDYQYQKVNVYVGVQ